MPTARMAAEPHQRPRQSQREAFYDRRNHSGNLAQVCRYPPRLATSWVGGTLEGELY